MSRLVFNHFPSNLYIKRQYSLSCLRIWKKIYGFEAVIIFLLVLADSKPLTPERLDKREITAQVLEYN